MEYLDNVEPIVTERLKIATTHCYVPLSIQVKTEYIYIYNTAPKTWETGGPNAHSAMEFTRGPLANHLISE